MAINSQLNIYHTHCDNLITCIIIALQIRRRHCTENWWGISRRSHLVSCPTNEARSCPCCSFLSRFRRAQGTGAANRSSYTWALLQLQGLQDWSGGPVCRSKNWDRLQIWDLNWNKPFPQLNHIHSVPWKRVVVWWFGRSKTYSWRFILPHKFILNLS